MLQVMGTRVRNHAEIAAAAAAVTIVFNDRDQVVIML